MGLRFRKSISIIPGVKLNLGKTGMSVSTGVPGFRKTFHTSGRVTTSVGIPGTGLYYVDTRKNNMQSPWNKPQSQSEAQEIYENYDSTYSELSALHKNSAAISPPVHFEESFDKPNLVQIDLSSLKSIHKTSDDSIDWTEILVSPTPPDDTYNAQMWEYYHTVAPKVLAGDIDSYLKLIYEVNPLNDLLSYGGSFEFGTDSSKLMEVEFTVNESALSDARKKMTSIEYNLFLQDYVCSICIRIARDMFALLPITNTLVHATLENSTILSVDFDRSHLSKIKFGYIDPSDTISQFNHRMLFSKEFGFCSILPLE